MKGSMNDDLLIKYRKCCVHELRDFVSECLTQVALTLLITYNFFLNITANLGKPQMRNKY